MQMANSLLLPLLLDGVAECLCACLVGPAEILNAVLRQITTPLVSQSKQTCKYRILIQTCP